VNECQHADLHMPELSCCAEADLNELLSQMLAQQAVIKMLQLQLEFVLSFLEIKDISAPQTIAESLSESVLVNEQRAEEGTRKGTIVV
jgi:hypothetical protein